MPADHPSATPARSTTQREKRVIWRLSDGKPGHDKQTQGLAAALGRLLPTEVHTLRLPQPGTGALAWLLGRFGPGRRLPAPWLILGAGHATHLPMLTARHARGGRAVVLMQPSLPLLLFDLCLIPAHDHPPGRSNVVATLGALNTVRPGAGQVRERGLMLVGGPSRHFTWDNAAVARQVNEIAAAEPGVQWTLTTSRRTPPEFLASLETLPNLNPVAHERTPPGWLEARLAESGQAWVSPDSVSMVYEALSAGCACGLLELTADPASRVAAGVLALAAAGRAHTLARWRQAGTLPQSTEPLREADRCAALILDRWA